MACPTCDHTMQRLGQLMTGDSYYWCPRCGTVRMKELVTNRENDSPPSLPKRVRSFLTSAELSIGNLQVAHTVGLDEASTLPGSRTIKG